MGILDRFRQLFTPSGFYKCPNCDYLLPKEEAVTSGWIPSNPSDTFTVQNAEK